MADIHICKGKNVNPQIENGECVVEASFIIVNCEYQVKKIRNQAKKEGFPKKLTNKIRIENEVVVSFICKGTTLVRKYKRFQCLVVPNEVATKLGLKKIPTEKIKERILWACT